MFLFLQFICAAILLVGIFIVTKRVLHGSVVLTAGLCITVILSSILSGIALSAIPMPTETVHIEATGEKNAASLGNEIALQSTVVDGKERPLEAPVEGNWFYEKKLAAYMWMDESDERLKSSVSEGITIQIPVGAGRSLYFLSNEQSGKVNIA